MSKSTRKAAYAAIDSERSYQRARWGDDNDRKRKGKTIDEFALYLDVYVGKLKELAATTHDQEKVTEKCDILRKIGALAVSAMEMHGSPLRQFDPVAVDAVFRKYRPRKRK